MRPWLCLLAFPLALAGCSDGGADPSGTLDADEGAQSETDVGPAAWTNTTLEGTFVGFNTPAVSGNPLVLLGEGYGTHSFTVPEGAQTLEVRVHLVSPVEQVMLRLIGPDCNDVACTHDVVTTGGTGTLAVADPEDGEWRSFLFRTTAGAGLTPYHVYVAVLA